MVRRHRSRGSKSGGMWLFLLGLVLGAGALYLFFDRPVPEPPRKDAEALSSPPSREAPRKSSGPRHASDHVEPTPVELVKVEPGPAGPVQGVRVALVIDDLGKNLDDLRTLAGLGVPVTYAVLPFEEQTPQVAAELRRRGEEILLHLPMEPKNGENPGPGALRQGMSDEELRQRTLDALRAVPGAVGVNNHMGSLLSAEQGPMTAVLGVLAERRLFFLDSRTSAESVGYRVATELGIPATERQIFLDGDPNPEAIQAQFQRLLALARSRGSAVAIGHPFPATLAMLESEVPKAKAEGYEFVPVSYLLTRGGGEE